MSTSKAKAKLSCLTPKQFLVAFADLPLGLAKETNRFERLRAASSGFERSIVLQACVSQDELPYFQTCTVMTIEST
jgi:hypothetical protein